MAARKQPDALKALEQARLTAAARAEDRASQEPEPAPSEESVEDCMLRLVVYCYASELKVGMGVMPDGMAIWIRLGFPKTSRDERAGLVSFCVSDTLQAVLWKAMAALDSGPKSTYWKPDQYAR